MANESYANDTDCVKSVQEKNPQFNTTDIASLFLSVVTAGRGVVIPPDDCNIEADLHGWSDWFKCRDPTTIKDWVNEYHVEIRQLGQKTFFTPAALRRAVKIRIAGNGETQATGEGG